MSAKFALGGRVQTYKQWVLPGIWCMNHWHMMHYQGCWKIFWSKKWYAVKRFISAHLMSICNFFIAHSVMCWKCISKLWPDLCSCPHRECTKECNELYHVTLSLQLTDYKCQTCHASWLWEANLPFSWLGLCMPEVHYAYSYVTLAAKAEWLCFALCILAALNLALNVSIVQCEFLLKCTVCWMNRLWCSECLCSLPYMNNTTDTETMTAIVLIYTMEFSAQKQCSSVSDMMKFFSPGSVLLDFSINEEHTGTTNQWAYHLCLLSVSHVTTCYLCR